MPEIQKPEKNKSEDQNSTWQIQKYFYRHETIPKHSLESAKLRALRAKNVFACQLALRAYVLTCLRALRAYVLTC